MEFKGIEHLKVWKLTPKSGPLFVVCKNCQTNFFGTNPDLVETAFIINTGGNVWESEIQIDETTTRSSSFNCDLDPAYDPERKHTEGTYKGQGPVMNKMDTTTLIGFLRTNTVKPLREKGDQDI